ncbi:hypothetical protein OFM35_29245, partial [Escherichia coli]|nr:hypothetical protein [Escherichia coli]
CQGGVIDGQDGILGDGLELDGRFPPGPVRHAICLHYTIPVASPDIMPGTPLCSSVAMPLSLALSIVPTP